MCYMCGSRAAGHDGGLDVYVSDDLEGWVKAGECPSRAAVSDDAREFWAPEA